MNLSQTQRIKKTSKKLDYLFMNIAYDINKRTFKITGNLNKVGQKTILEAFLQAQVDAGIDNSKANERDVYNIRFKVDLSYDNIRVSDNTGNKGLREGILIDVYRELY